MTATGSIPSSTTTTTNQSTFPMVQLNAQQTRGQTKLDGTARVSHMEPCASNYAYCEIARLAADYRPSSCHGIAAITH